MQSRFRQVINELVNTISAIFSSFQVLFKYNLKVASNYYRIRASKLFDNAWYTRNYNYKKDFNDPILHYVLMGSKIGNNPNALFDNFWYKEQFPEIIELEMDPLIHYIKIGSFQLLPTSTQFDSKTYMENNPDIQDYRRTALAHYLNHGHLEGRFIHTHKAKQFERQKIIAPSLSKFEKIKPPSSNYSDLQIDVIIPVYKGYDDTINCIYSILLSNCKIGFEIIVIDDCSPDQKLSDALVDLSNLGLIELIKNNENLGFVKSVNKGMNIHPDRDILLLNSDTEVYNDWLIRIHDQAYNNNADTVTPLSNNATICSYPKWLADNMRKMEIEYYELDLLAKKINNKSFVEIPTGVGFCMYIKRIVLDRLGYFNESEFGKGYGEENDFCMRVLKEGGKNILALDTFVRHTGEVSFEETSTIQKKKGMESLLRIYPNYNKLVRKHIDEDPSLYYRQLLDLSRISNPELIKENIIIITHNWGGGIERYLRDRRELQSSKRIDFLIVTSLENGTGGWRVNSLDTIDVPNLNSFNFEDKLENWRKWIYLFNISKVEIHSLGGWGHNAVTLIPQWCNSLNLPYEFMVHDYMSLCPMAHLIDPQGNFCNLIGLSCNLCIKKVNYPGNISQWRKNYHALLKGSQKVSAPSHDTAKRIKQVFSDIEIKVQPHRENTNAFATPLSKKYNKGEILRIGIIGAIGPHKGSEVIYDCASYASEKKLPVKFVIIGFTNIIKLNQLPNVEITGSYKDHEVYKLIKDKRLHAAFIPSIWPETYCYTLSIAIRARMPVFAFDIGAQAERLREVNNSTLLRLDKFNNPKYLLNQIQNNVAQIEYH